MRYPGLQPKTPRGNRRASKAGITGPAFGALARNASLLALAPILGFAEPGHAQALFGARGPGGQCLAAIATAEHDLRIPDRLLAAIGQVESGRPDPLGGGVAPWPWTIDANGQGRYFATAADAIDAVRDLQAHGVRSIDVGCVQVNLEWHPQAFSSLQEAFDPVANARYGARFLNDLFAVTHRWDLAIAYYHSRTPGTGTPYAQRVLGVANAKAAGVRTPVQIRLEQMVNAWGATLDGEAGTPRPWVPSELPGTARIAVSAALEVAETPQSFGRGHRR